VAALAHLAAPEARLPPSHRLRYRCANRKGV
jgi:hypothetical protein